MEKFKFYSVADVHVSLVENQIFLNIFFEKKINSNHHLCRHEKESNKTCVYFTYALFEWPRTKLFCEKTVKFDLKKLMV